MEELLNGPAYWYWFAAGVLLIALEALVPGFVLVWIGVAAISTAIVTLIFQDMALVYQLLIFAGVAVASVLTGRRWVTRLNERSESPLLNRRGEQHIGQTFTLREPIRDGRGRVRVGDSMWAVRGPDLPAGARIRVTAVEGAILVVERAD
jgi:membrane protein implicated in regulation of membrane protease activity